MKKFFKILGIGLFLVLVGLYMSFLLVLPNVIDLSKYKADIQKLVKEQANLDLSYNCAQVVTTPLLGAGVKIDDIKVTLPDGTTIFSTPSIKSVVSLPNLLLLTVRISSVDIEKPFVNVEILKNGEDYKIVKHIENILNTNKEATFGKKPEVKEQDGFHFDPAWIKIVIPNVRLHDYKIFVKDLGTNHYLDLHGNKLIFGYYNRKNIRVRTNAELYSDNNKNISANIDFDTFLPPPSPKLDEEDDPAEKIDIPFINPVKTYQNYDLKADIDSKIKIRFSENDGFTSFGHLNIENLTLKLSKIQLPKSYLKLRTMGKNAKIDTDIYASKDEDIHIFGKINYSRHPKIDMNIKSGVIKFQDLLTLAEAFLESINVKNELNQFKASGSIVADCYIKSNFKRLRSNGYIKVQNGALRVRNLGEVLSRVNINIVLDDNILNIVKSGLFVGNSEVTVNGSIDEKSFTDVNIKANSIPLQKLYAAFAPKDLRNSFKLKSGNLSSAFSIKGKMKDAVANIKIQLKNFDFGDKNNIFEIKNDLFETAFNYDSKIKNLFGEINNNGFKLIFPKTASNISVPKLKVNIEDKNIDIAPNILYFNDHSAVRYAGSITNYLKLENIDFSADGEVNTSDIIKFIGQEVKPYINSRGKLPVKLSFAGNNDKKTFFVQAQANQNNFITPIDIDSLQNKQTSLQANMDFKPNRIKIKNTGLYTVSVSQDQEGQEITSLGKVLEIDGTLENNRINLLKIAIPKALAGKLHVFPRSKFILDDTKFFAFGSSSSPIIRGELNLHDIILPEIHSALNRLNIKISGRELTFAIQKFMMRNSDLNIQGKYSLEPSKNIVLKNLGINSTLINLDDITAVTESLNKYMPKSSGTNTASTGSSDIPVEIPNGTINMRKIVTGNIELTNTISRLILANNILHLQNLSTNIFKGDVLGNIDVDLIKLLVKADLNGKNIDVAKALLDASGMKDALSGKADFNANLNINASAKTSEEQMKGIDGKIKFLVKDGQFGPFGKLENMILAENIRESQFFQTALGGVINSLSTIDTTHFAELDGEVILKDGICDIEHITTKGNVMNLHILGKFDILKNYTDMKVRVKLTSIISNLLGPINAINPVNLMNSAASMNVVTAKAFSVFCETVPESEFKVLPEFSNKYVETASTKFQLGVRGDVAKPLTLIKSFKWLTSKADYDKAMDYVNSLPEPIEGSTATTIEEAIEEAKALEAAKQAAKEAEKKTLKYKLKHLIKRENKTQDE